MIDKLVWGIITGHLVAAIIFSILTLVFILIGIWHWTFNNDVSLLVAIKPALATAITAIISMLFLLIFHTIFEKLDWII